MKNEDHPNNKNQVLNLFEGVDEGTIELKPLTKGLGFKDRVSEGVYTMEVGNEIGDEIDFPSSDGGSLDIGNEDMGDGTLNIGSDGSLDVQTAEMVQPILFHSGHDGLIKKTAKKSGESILGAFVDALFVLAFSILTIAVLTELTEYKFNFEGADLFSRNSLGKMAVVFAAYFLSYKILARLFFGKTLGEWSSRHQLGLLNQQHRFFYPVQVLLREAVCLFTGVFGLPLLSVFFKRDVGFYFSGLQTYVEQKK